MKAATINILAELRYQYPETEIRSFVRIITEYITGKQFTPFLIDDTILTESQIRWIEEAIVRLKANEPIQYIIGNTEFFSLPLAVNKNVLIPRPETEELVELILNENASRYTKYKVLDIGTGSGAIAIALKKNRPEWDIDAIDISEKALEVARENANNNAVEIKFILQDVLAWQSKSDKESYLRQYDIIVSNPPYIMQSEKNEMKANVLDYEPHTALFVPDEDSLLFYRKIAEIGLHVLKKEGKIYFEINRAKGDDTFSMLNNMGYDNVHVIRDISGNDRIVKAYKA